MLTAQEIRKRYLDFFKRHQHEVVASGPLVPPEDPTLLFTNAGMVQFKKLFLGEEKRHYKKATTCQKCLRVSGKHNDLENVGRTARHHTFFEMLGNFSFGDYFKREAISWAWEFVTKELNLPKDKLWVTIFRDDDEAFNIWREVAGLPPERIVRMGEKDNFWTMGETGPCGPCSEIYIDQGEDMACGPDCGIGSCDCDRFLEIWNLVFTQFDQQQDGSRVPLAAPNIDTGMGLERIAAVCQGKKSNFDCDLFQEIIQYAAALAGVKYSASAPDTNDIDTALRVIADHARAAAFLVAEGILPSNESRGYVLRRLVRRALRFATLMGVHEPFLHKVARKVTEVMGDAYPELVANADFIDRAVYEEEKRFAQTLDNGLKILEEELERLEKSNLKNVSGEFCFKLHDTYGFPLDIVCDVAEKRGFEIDGSGFEKLMHAQRERARSNQKKSGLLGQGGGGELAAICKQLVQEGAKTEFVGYNTLNAHSKILAILDASGTGIQNLGEGNAGYILVDQSPFYGESGGQTGDQGILETTSGKAVVIGAIKPVPEIILLEVEIRTGEIHAGDEAELAVNADIRKATAANHTCTHLLHASLRRVLGGHVKQAGSLVNANRLRFDFSHFSGLSAEELAAVERDVNRAIMADYEVKACEMGHDEALEKGAMALFSEKYGDRVRVLTVGDDASPESMELCGGTHLARTGEAGSFIIVAESAVAAGTRRIEAVTAWNAYNYMIGQRGDIRLAAAELKTRPSELVEKVKATREEVRKLRKALEKGAASPDSDVAGKNAEEINGITLVMQKFDNAPVKALREMMDKLRGRYASNAVVCLASVNDGKISLLLYVSKDLHKKFDAPELVRIVAAPCGGSGGGRPDLANAGGSKPEALDKAFTDLKNYIAQKA